MLGLPKNTEIKKQLPKKAIYAKFQMNTATKDRIDADISRINIVNEISPAKINISAGETIPLFFVVQVLLKKKDYDKKAIITISKLIPQKMLFILECGQQAKLAVFHTKLIQTNWQTKDSLSVEIKGLNLDDAWENIVVQVGGVRIESGNTLDEQLEADDRRQRLKKEIDRLDKLARKEKQPKKKFDLVQEINKLREMLNS